MTTGSRVEPRGTLLAEGKTKIIWSVPGTDHVLIESKDDITAGDGAKHDIMSGKAVLATRTTVNCFQLLRKAGIPTHFLAEADERTFWAKRAQMIPIEVVVRRAAYGSYLKRHPEAARGQQLGQLTLELFTKDDQAHDPLVEYDFDAQTVRRYDASRPVSPASLIDERPIAESPFGVTKQQLGKIGELAFATFGALEAAWAEQDVVLADLKIELGLTPEGEMMVADVIDNDSGRLWPGGDPDNMLDKQLYREQRMPLDEIAHRYAWVAAMTEHFAA